MQVQFGLIKDQQRTVLIQLHQRNKREVSKLPLRQPVQWDWFLGAADNDLQLNRASARRLQAEASQVVPETQTCALDNAVPNLTA